VAEPKTRPTDADVGAFLDSVPDPRRRDDAKRLCTLMAEVTGSRPTMWGTTIVGFGSRPLRYADGRLADWPVVGFAPRKQALVLYLMDGFESHADVLAELGPHSLGKSCLYVKRLDALDPVALRALLEASVAASGGVDTERG
jgi:hypothetical protein